MTEPSIAEVFFVGERLRVRLHDGRELIVPKASFRRLREATNEQLANYEVTRDGEGVHWPDIDEDISVRGFLRYAVEGV